MWVVKDSNGCVLAFNNKPIRHGLGSFCLWYDSEDLFNAPMILKPDSFPNLAPGEIIWKRVIREEWIL